MIRLRAGKVRNDRISVPETGMYFFTRTVPRPNLETDKGYRATLLGQSGWEETDHSPPSTTEVKNTWTLPPLHHVFMLWCLDTGTSGYITCRIDVRSVTSWARLLFEKTLRVHLLSGCWQHEILLERSLCGSDVTILNTSNSRPDRSTVEKFVSHYLLKKFIIKWPLFWANVYHTTPPPTRW